MDSPNKSRDLLRSLFDAIPALALAVDEDVRILECNAAVAGLLGKDRTTIMKRRGGEALHCLHSYDVPEGCGRGPFCKDCIVRDSVKQAFRGNAVARWRTKLELVRDGETVELYALITASPFVYDAKQLVLLIIEDISEMVELQRIVPICMLCKKVRNDDQYWTDVEAYFKRYWDLDFSHGYCPACAAKEMAKLKQDLKQRS
jgi:PAS domain-containing protein